MESLKARWTGTTPIMMHNVRLANPLDPIVKKIKPIAKKRNKTDDDYEQIAWLEFQGGLYWDEEIGVFVPGWNVQGVIRDAGKLRKLGAAVLRGLSVAEDKIALDTKYPRDLEKMFKTCSDIRPVTVSTSTTMRCRPHFSPPWSLTFTVNFNSAQLDREQIRELMDDAGKLIGLGDFRPRFGKFDSEILDEENGK
jgi:hypothetical protein